jgi:hypothetical protein
MLIPLRALSSIYGTNVDLINSGARWLRDVDLLKQDLVEFAPTEHQHRRSTYYLAKTLDWLDRKDEVHT